MIYTKEVKVKITNDLSSDYIDTELSKLGKDILRWSIVDYDSENYIVQISIVE